MNPILLLLVMISCTGIGFCGAREWLLCFLLWGVAMLISLFLYVEYMDARYTDNYLDEEPNKRGVIFSEGNLKYHVCPYGHTNTYPLLKKEKNTKINCFYCPDCTIEYPAIEKY
jgi:hypothetical protein